MNSQWFGNIYMIDMKIIILFLFHSGWEYTKQCVHDHFANATDAKKQTAMEAMKMVMMLHKEACAREMMDRMDRMEVMDKQQPTCNVNASLWCLGKLGAYLSTASAFQTDSQCG